MNRRMEKVFARRHEVAGFRSPAHERLDAADSMRGELDFRLEVDLELAARHCALQLRLELPERGLLLRRVGTVDVVRQLLLARFLERAPDCRIVLSTPLRPQADTGKHKERNNGGRDQPQKPRSDPAKRHRLLAAREFHIVEETT